MAASLVDPCALISVHVEMLESCRRTVYTYFAAPPCAAEACNVDFCDVWCDLLVVCSVHVT